MTSEPATLTVDARGRRCPLPIIDLARATATAAAGTVVDLIADDPAAATDVPAWCAMRNHEYVGAEPHDEGRSKAVLYRIRL